MDGTTGKVALPFLYVWDLGTFFAPFKDMKYLQSP
jgi:hypothetical protein